MSIQHQSPQRRGAAARADSTDRPAAAATHEQTPEAPDASLATDDPTPLEVMLATMRWAHQEAERQSADAAARAGKEADDTTRLIAGLRGLALSVAKDAAPYLHARLASATPRDPTQRTHEEWLLELEKLYGASHGR